MISILFVCLGNICRSPCLAAVLQDKVDKAGLSNRFHIDSCAVTSYHVGESVDPRMYAVAKEHGIIIEHRAKLFEMSYFSSFDYIFAVDSEVKEILLDMASNPVQKQKVHLATEFSQRFKDKAIPDPYYGKDQRFAYVFEIANDSCESILSICLPYS